jgi:predicted nucleic acid-binding Zn ribbon protein
MSVTDLDPARVGAEVQHVVVGQRHAAHANLRQPLGGRRRSAEQEPLARRYVRPVATVALTGPTGGGSEWASSDTLARSSLTVPVYVYRRDDGSTFEIEQRMAADALLCCPRTGQRVERVLQPFAPRYKGTGFYSTDHRKPKGDRKSNG